MIQLVVRVRLITQAFFCDIAGTVYRGLTPVKDEHLATSRHRDSGTARIRVDDR